MNTNTETAVSVPKAPELALFEHSTPTVSGSLVVTPRTRVGADGKVERIGVAMTLPKRKDLATKLGVKAKDGLVTAQLREASDALLTMGIAEMQAGMRDNKLTGARFSKSKSGRLTLSAMPLEKRAVTPEQLEAALRTLTPAERKELMKKLNQVPAQEGITIEAQTGKSAKGKGKKAPTPAKSAAKTPEQTAPAPEAQVPSDPPVEPAIDNIPADMPEAPAQ